MPPFRFDRPIRLPPNPVWRSYTGGSVLRSFRGEPGTGDDHFPEDWLASTASARNGANSQYPDEGTSRVCFEGEEIPLTELLRQAPAELWGDRQPRGEVSPLLMKLLDCSVRLHLQAHPDRAFARRHLNSSAGKTECWYILETRGTAHVNLGFQRPPAPADWERMIREQDRAAMLACFDEIPVQPGDCLVVPGGTPHAIGEGIFMIELQEPTDWVVRCEFSAAGLELPPEACFMGLDLETCMRVFNFERLTVAEVRERLQQKPAVLGKGEGFLHERIIGPAWETFFRLERLRGEADASWSGGEFMVLIARQGSGMIGAGGSGTEVKAGETWLLPGGVANWGWSGTGDPWELLLAKLPIAPDGGSAAVS